MAKNPQQSTRFLHSEFLQLSHDGRHDAAQSEPSTVHGRHTSPQAVEFGGDGDGNEDAQQDQGHHQVGEQQLHLSFLKDLFRFCPIILCDPNSFQIIGQRSEAPTWDPSHHCAGRGGIERRATRHPKEVI